MTCKHDESTMQRFDVASERDGVGIDIEWCTYCGTLLKWKSQITGKTLVELND